MWRTSTSLPKLPLRPTASLPGSLRPTSVARTVSIAACRPGPLGWSMVMPRSACSTSSAGRPSSCSNTLPSTWVMVRTGATGEAPWVTRETRCTPAPKATPESPPLNTPLAAPWPLMVPSPLTANCTAVARLEARPPNR